MKNNFVFSAKRIISLIIAVLFVLPLSIFAYQPTGETESESIVYKYKKEILTLKKLGVYSFDDLSEVDGEKKITRAEFSEYLVSALNAAKITDKIYFSDVKTDYWACGSINALVNLGAIDGMNRKTFAPDEYVTYAQACKMILSVAGYRGVVDAQGYSDPLMGYAAYAKRLKLSVTGLENDDELTFADTALLLYNGMKMHSVLAVGDKAEVEDSTLFEAYRKVYIGTGRLESYIGGSINENKCESSDEIYINSIKFTKDSDIDAESLFGNLVEVTYIKNSDDDMQVIYLEDYESSSDMLEIKSDEVNGFDLSGYQLSYSKDEDKKSKKSAALLKGTIVVYNGEVSDRKLSNIVNEFVDENRYGTMIETGGNIYFVDAGAPLADIMANHNIPYEKVRAIFITHSHLDHCAGLPVFISMEKWHRKESTTQIYLPDNMLYNGLLPIFNDRTEISNNKIKPHLFEDGCFYDDDLVRVKAIPTWHLSNIGLPSYAFSVKIKDKSLMFTGDLTEEFDDFPAEATEHECDAVVCELTHFSVERAIPKLNEVKTKHLIFNHVRDDKIECINLNKEKIVHDYQIVNDRDVVVI